MFWIICDVANTTQLKPKADICWIEKVEQTKKREMKERNKVKKRPLKLFKLKIKAV